MDENLNENVNEEKEVINKYLPGALTIITKKSKRLSMRQRKW